MTHAIRSFLGIPIEDPARAVVLEVMDTLRERPNGDRVRWVRPDNLHVTLRFLGDVLPNKLPDVMAEVGSHVRLIPGFDCRLHGIRLFPSSKHPKVLAMALDAEGHLTELAQAVERGASQAGMPPDRHGFKAHLTVGRLKGHAYPSVHDEFSDHDAMVVVDRVVLYRSELRPEGPVYTEIESIALVRSQSSSQQGSLHG